VSRYPVYLDSAVVDPKLHSFFKSYIDSRTERQPLVFYVKLADTDTFYRYRIVSNDCYHSALPFFYTFTPEYYTYVSGKLVLINGDRFSFANSDFSSEYDTVKLRQLLDKGFNTDSKKCDLTGLYCPSSWELRTGCGSDTILRSNVLRPGAPPPTTSTVTVRFIPPVISKR
jgi:hypothetical protein